MPPQKQERRGKNTKILQGQYSCSLGELRVKAFLRHELKHLVPTCRCSHRARPQQARWTPPVSRPRQARPGRCHRAVTHSGTRGQRGQTAPAAASPEPCPGRKAAQRACISGKSSRMRSERIWQWEGEGRGMPPTDQRCSGKERAAPAPAHPEVPGIAWPSVLLNAAYTGG